MAVILLLSCSSCSQRGTGKSIIFAVDASPSTLDPQYASETGAQIIINNVFEGLVRYDENGKIIPGIAKSWTVSEDGLIYNFILQENTEWYCPSSMKTEFGDAFYDKFCKEKVTAADFVYACRRTVDPAINSSLADRLMVINGAADIHSGKSELSSLGVTAKSAVELEFRLTEPCSDFLSRLTECEFMPCNEEFYNAMKGRYGLTSDYLLCNGPFYLSYWDPESQITIKSNKYYAGSETVSPASVVISFDGDRDSVFKKLSNGSLSAAVLSPRSEIPENVNVVKEIPNTVTGFIFNCEDEITKYQNVRKALCMSMDRGLFTETDALTATDGFIPASCYTGGDTYRSRVGSQTPVISSDDEGAQKLWTQALKKLGTDKISLTVLCPEEFDVPVRKQLQKWQKVFGVSLAVSVSNMTDDEIDDALGSGDYQIAVGSVSAEDKFTVDFLESFSGGGVFNFTSDKYEATIDYLMSVNTDKELLGACFTAEDIILKQGIFFPLYSASSKFVVSDETEGIAVFDSESTISFINARRFD